MHRSYRPRPPAAPQVDAGYWLEETDSDAVRAAKVLVAARRLGRERAAAEAEAQRAQASVSNAIEKMRAAVARGGRA
jgi:hypothetical protein